MTLPIYDKGDTARVGNHANADGTFTNADGSLRQPFQNPSGVNTDPTAVTLEVIKSDGTLLVYGWPTAGANGALTKQAIGQFYFDVVIDLAGGPNWKWNLAGTGAITAASEGEFRVRPTAF